MAISYDTLKGLEVDERNSVRRLGGRVNVAVPLRIQLPSVEAAFSGDAINLSKVGMFIPMQEPIPVGVELDLELVLNDGCLLLHAQAEVVRQQLSEPLGVGVRLMEVSYEAQELIDRIVADDGVFGHYRIDRLIGRGGMAEVYLATPLAGDWVGQQVAIKRILPQFAKDPVFVSLFEQEAHIIESLIHPNIVEVIDFGEVNGVPYIAMEYVAGCNLAVLIKRCMERGMLMPIEFSCCVVQIIADALEHVHHAVDENGACIGIVHRDIAPSNIFISHLGEIKLGDFGVAQIQGKKNVGAEFIVGKIPYMAPEIIRGYGASPASDVFALGAVFYEMLTNKTAFNTGKERTTLRRIKSGRVIPPSKWRPEISSNLDSVLLRALSSRLRHGGPMDFRVWAREWFHGRIERYASAAEFSAALGSLFDPEVVAQLDIAAVVRNLIQ